MSRTAVILLALVGALTAQMHPLQELVEAARTESPNLKELLERRDAYGNRLPGVEGRDGALVWGQDFLFVVESDTPASVEIDKQPVRPMRRIPGSDYWYRLETLRMGRTHQYHYFRSDGTRIGGYEVAAYNPDSYPLPGVPRGVLSDRKTLSSKIYPDMTANYWVYVNAGADMENGAPLMVWQDGETIVDNADLLRLRLQTVSDNLVAKGLIPPMVHVLIQPGEAPGERRMRSIQYDTVSDAYGRYLIDEVLPDIEKTYKLRQDAYSRAIGGASSGAICAFNVAWYHPAAFQPRALPHRELYGAAVAS